MSSDDLLAAFTPEQQAELAEINATALALRERTRRLREAVHADRREREAAGEDVDALAEMDRQLEIACGDAGQQWDELLEQVRLLERDVRALEAFRRQFEREVQIVD